MEKTILILVSLFIVAAILAISISSAEKRETERIEQERFLQETKLYDCQQSAFTVYKSDWNSQCAMLNKGNECSLPLYLSDRVTDSYETSLDRCVVLYK